MAIYKKKSVVPATKLRTPRVEAAKTPDAA
jgi:hypothetical protein